MRQPVKSGFVPGVIAGLLGGVLLSATVATAAGTTLFHPQIGQVNGTKITESQLLWYLFSRESEDVVKDLVFFSILAGEAPKLGVSVDPAKAEAILQEVHGDRGSLIFQSLDKTEVKAALVRELTAREVLKAKKAQLAKDPAFAVTEEEIVNAYLQNTAKMQIPEQVLLSVINTSNLKSAELALKDLKAGKSFAEVAKSYSEDEVTKDIGGKIDRPIPKGIYFRGPFKKLDEIAFKLTKGQHSEVIPAADQYFIIQVDERIAAKDITLDEARPKLKATIEDIKIAPAVGEWLQSIGELADLSITYPIFEVTAQDLRNLDKAAERATSKDGDKDANGAPATP